ncbi:hypothetical protein MCHI_002712, partial [Candidatus Magnetoovum chiemensis]
MTEDFIYPNNKEIDRKRLIEAINYEIEKAKTQSSAFSNTKAVAQSERSKAKSDYLSEIRSFIALAKENANAGLKVSPMEQFDGAKRKIAILVGDLIVYLLSFITDVQRKYNKSIIKAIELTTDNMETLIKENDNLKKALLSNNTPHINTAHDEDLKTYIKMLKDKNIISADTELLILSERINESLSYMRAAAEASADAVLLYHTIEDTPLYAITTVFSELFRILKPKG